MKSVNFIVKRNLIPAFAGFFCVLLGIICLIGWYAHAIELIQFRPGLTSMVYNNALNFFLFGLGILTLLTSYSRFAIIFGFLILGIAGLTLLEYGFDTQLGIDEFFMKDYLFTNTISPGRMSPNTAISHTIGGMALILLSLKKTKQIYYYALLFLSIILFSLSSTSLVGYAINMSGGYKWYSFIPMALQTAVGFLIVFFGIAALIYHKHKNGEINISHAVPAFAFLFVLSFSLLLWRASYQDALVTVQNLTNLESEKLKSTIQIRMEESLLDLMGFGSKALGGHLVTEREWIHSAEFYKKNHPWYDEISWIDPEFNVLYRATFDNENDLLKNDSQIKQDLFEKAIVNKGMSFSPLFNFTPHTRGFLVCLPIYTGPNLEGFIVGFINTDYLFKTITDDILNDGFIVNFTEHNSHPHQEKVRMSESDIIATGDFKLYGLEFPFQVKPTLVLIKQHTHSILSYLSLFIGLLIGVLIAIVLKARIILKQKQSVLEETQEKLREQFEEAMHLNQVFTLLKSMADGVRVCSSLNKSCELISHFCELLLPNSSGNIYLNEDNEKTLSLICGWGNKSLEQFSFSIQKCNSLDHSFSILTGKEACELICEKTIQHVLHSSQEDDLFIPMFNHDKILGLLHVTSGMEKKLPLNLIETIIKQITPALGNIKLRDLLKIQATRDPLTNLFNRRYLDESLPRELYQAKRYSRPLSLLMLDIDHFKQINDTYGHKGGDKVLKGIASLLETRSRRGDILCRFGGEEFLIVFHDSTSEGAYKRADQIREEISKLHFSKIGNEIKNVTVSIGISSFPEDNDIMEDLILTADEALYRAKEKGRNRVEVGKNRERSIALSNL